MRRPRILYKLQKPIAGFTLVELLIVITVISILATIGIVSYNGVQERARNAQRLDDLQMVQDLVEIYEAKNGAYPQTTSNPKANWHAADVRTDDNCSNGTSQADWIPGVNESLPQGNGGTGVNGLQGCYLYVSDGTEYVISAWNMVSKPQTSALYHRQGFRQFQSSSSTQFYTCNSNTVGGATGGYNAAQDYYKHSYTITNITDCNETPPPGA